MPFGRSKSQMDNIKRSSYYVCFIGAKESSVVRDRNHGHEFVYPAMHYLLRTAVEAGPLASAPKITLQMSSKGMKIVQNVHRHAVVPMKSGFISGNPSTKTDALRHTIPHHCVTCAYQGEPPYDDLVATILLIFNPATHCPVHIHVYRCDSSKTAALLTQQLVTMAERPENQARFAAIEGRLRGKGLLHPATNGPNNFHISSPTGRAVLSDGQSSSGRTSSSPESSETGKQRRPLSLMSSNDRSSEFIPVKSVANNADKLAAELKEKLRTKDSAPLLLPPKDYDTVNRSRGRVGLTTKEDIGQNIVSRKSNTDKFSENRSKSQSLEEDDEWTVEDEMEEFREREAAVLSRADFGTHGFHERLKRYCSLNDVFGESRTDYMDPVQIAHYLAGKVPELGSPPTVTPTSSDGNAAYRPRPYYFSTIEESENLEKNRLVNHKTHVSQKETISQSPRDREPQMIIQSRHVRPSMPLPRNPNHRPIVNERVRPASFYERMRFDDMQEFQEGRFVRPEMVYYQYRC